MKKKRTITVALVGVAVVLALVVSRFINWPVDYENASGDIAKSSRFSRNTADGNVGNMKELIQNDEEYKNGLVTAYMVMKTRAEQFNALVDMSAAVAGDIKELEPVLKELIAAQPMVKNVCASMEVAAKDLNAVLGGGDADEIEQNTSNAALAYSTLQKQNKLATQFIEVVDSYQKTANVNDRLKFVRDQWVDYQQMTAALTNDEQLAQELSKKGYLLSENKRGTTLSSFDTGSQVAVINNSVLENLFSVENALSNSMIDRAIKANPDLSALFAMNPSAVVNANVQDAALKANVEDAALKANVQDAALKANVQDAALKAQELAVQGLMNFGLGDGLANLRNTIQGAMMSLVKTNELGQTVQVNQLLSNEVNSVINSMVNAELGNHQVVEGVK